MLCFLCGTRSCPGDFHSPNHPTCRRIVKFHRKMEYVNTRSLIVTELPAAIRLKDIRHGFIHSFCKNICAFLSVTALNQKVITTRNLSGKVNSKTVLPYNPCSRAISKVRLGYHSSQWRNTQTTYHVRLPDCLLRIAE